MQDLEASLAQQAPPAVPDNPALHELPPLVIDGIPTPVDKMTQVGHQANVCRFIICMLRTTADSVLPMLAGSQIWSKYGAHIDMNFDECVMMLKSLNSKSAFNFPACRVGAKYAATVEYAFALYVPRENK